MRYQFSPTSTTDSKPISILINAVNRVGGHVLREQGFAELWDILAPGRLFRANRKRLEDWLKRTGSTRLAHGHVPHGKNGPDAYHGGRLPEILAYCRRDVEATAALFAKLEKTLLPIFE